MSTRGTVTKRFSAVCLEYRTKDGHDSIVLLDHSLVRSHWDVTPELLRSFCDCSYEPDDWDDQGIAGKTGADYGEALAERYEYALRPTQPDKWAATVERILQRV